MKTILKQIQIISLITCSLTLVSVTAQTPEIPDRGPIPFDTYDADGNGTVSESEFNAIRAARIALREESGQQMRGMANAPSFSELDTNNDAQLSSDELSTGQQSNMRGRGQGMGKGRQLGRGEGKGMGKGNGQRQGMGQKHEMPTFAEFDRDGNGVILEQEFNEARGYRISERAKQGYQMRGLVDAPKFSDIDANGDGQVDNSEFDTHQKEHCQEGNKKRN